MIQNNPYIVGGNLPADSPTYVTRKADQELLDICRAGELAYILTSRQMGKSSLMVQTAKKLREENCHVVMIDLTEIGVDVSRDQWYSAILEEIAEQLDLETDALDWWEAHEHVGAAKRLSDFIQDVVLTEVSEQIVLFIDEIDSTLSLDFSTDDFFAALRFLYQARERNQGEELSRFSVVLIGVATPDDLISDPNRTPFNVGHAINLTDFSLEEAEPLKTGLPENYADSLLPEIVSWTGGHPYLTQRLCQAVSENLNQSADSLNTIVDDTVQKTFFSEQADKDSNLEFVRNMLTNRLPKGIAKEEILNEYRNIIRKPDSVVDEAQSLVKNHLKLSGAVKSSGTKLKVRNKLYQQTFDDVWANLATNWTDCSSTCLDTKRFIRFYNL